MELPQSIIEALQNGATPEDLELKFPWELLTQAQVEDLFAQAKGMGRSQAAYHLLVYLNRIAKDDWFNVRVLALLFQHPGTPGQERSGRLAAMRQTLDTIARTLPEEGDLAVHYKKLNAFYYVLAARSRRDAGDPERALALFETALDIYKGLQLDASAQKVILEMQSIHVERRAFEVTRTNPFTTIPDPPVSGPKETGPAEPQPPFAADEPVESRPVVDEDIRALQSQRDALALDVQDLDQRRKSLLSQESETQKRLRSLENQVKDQQRILGEKQALLGQMDHLSEQEARLRQTLELLAGQENDQLKKLEGLRREARLLEKQVEILKRQSQLSLQSTPIDPSAPPEV